jgi:hypothetical protein
MEAILRGDIISICNRKHSISKGLAGVIDKSLLNNPLQRYQDAGEMKKALEKAIL